MRESSFPLQKRKILTQTFTNGFTEINEHLAIYVNTQVTSIYVIIKEERNVIIPKNADKVQRN